MKLILHTGFHKTGSSAIQAFCRLNREHLAVEGVLYPETALTSLLNPSTPTSEAGHRKFANLLASPTNRRAKKLLEEIINEADSYPGIHTVIISSETFSAPQSVVSTAAMSTLSEYFDEVRVLLYLRRQDDWAESFYKEVLCWTGRQEDRPFNSFRRGFLLPWLDYEQRVEKWASEFGQENVIVKSYDDRVDKNIIRDFFIAIGVAAERLQNCHFIEKRNPSLPGCLVPLMLDINKRGLGKEQKSQLTHFIFELLAKSEQQGEWVPVLSESKRAKFKAEYQEGNKALCEKYGIEACELLTFETARPSPETEICLQPEQLNLVQQKVDELLELAGNKTLRNRSRSNRGRIGISCLLNEAPEQVRVFVAYHLALGVSRIRLYFDNPDDSMLEYDFASTKVEAIACNASFWQEKLGREPENNAEKLATCHQDGLNYLNQVDDIDWAINLDADELLYVDPKTTLSRYLASISRRYDQLKAYPLEAVFVSESDSNLFSARYFKVPRLQLLGSLPFFSRIERRLRSIGGVSRFVLGRLKTAGIFLAWSKQDEALYLKHKPLMSQVMRKGFLAHRQGRTFTRHGIQLDQMTSHNPKSSRVNLTLDRFNTSVFLLHYDAADYDAWHLKWHRRIYGNTTASAIGEQRRKQQDMFREASEAGGDAVLELFREFFVFSDTAVKELTQAGLMVKLDLSQLEEIR